MKNRIALKAEPRRTAIVLAIFTLISLFLVWALAFSVNKDCMQLDSLIRSSYDYSVTAQESVLENDYYQFNAGIDFTLTADSQTSLNANIIMQTDSSVYTDLVYWNANELSTHGIAVSIDQMKFRKGKNPICDIDATIICERDSHKGIIIGKGGAMLKNIGTGARIEMEKLLLTKVNLKLFVKVRREWRDNYNILKTLGYSQKK